MIRVLKRKIFIIRSLLFLFFYLSPPVAFADEEIAENDGLRHLFDAALESSSKRFFVIGYDKIQNFHAARWAENCALRIEKTIGMPLPAKRWRTFRILLKECKNEKNDNSILASLNHDGHRWAYRLELYNPETALYEKATEKLFALILSAYVSDVYLSISDNLDSNPPMFPLWLAKGLFDSMDPQIRAQNAGLIYFCWSEGKLPSLADFLNQMENKDWDENVSEVQSAMAALLSRWMTVHPRKTIVFKRLFHLIAENRKLDAKSLAFIMDKSEVSELLDDWDGWILRQKTVVHVPGVASRLALEHLKSQLMVSPSNFFSLSEVAFMSGLKPADLLSFRNEPWMKELVAVKCDSLRLAAFGRGRDCENVAQLYCDYFKALISNKSEKTLKKMLKKADDALAELEDTVQRMESLK